MQGYGIEPKDIEFVFENPQFRILHDFLHAHISTENVVTEEELALLKTLHENPSPLDLQLELKREEVGTYFSLQSPDNALREDIARLRSEIQTL